MNNAGVRVDAAAGIDVELSAAAVGVVMFSQRQLWEEKEDFISFF